MTIAEIVKQRLDELGWTNYRLTQALPPKVSRDSVYRWLTGKQALRSDSLEAVLAAVGLTVTKVKGWKPPKAYP